MRNCLGYARVFRVVYQYFIDDDPSTLYTIAFGSLKSANEWLSLKCNWNKTVTQMLMRYDYPEHLRR